jgi:hypothetical protein
MLKRLLLLFVPLFLFSQNPDDKRILDQLCSEVFSGRGYVNNGDALAADFIAAEFKRLGLKKIGKQYYQNFRFEVNTFPGQVEMRINGVALQPGEDFVVNPASPSARLKRRTMLINELFTNVEELLNLNEILDVNEHILVLDKDRFKTREEQILLMSVVSKTAQAMPVILLNNGTPIWHVSQHQWRFPVFEVNRAVYQEGEVELVVDAQLIQHTAKNIVARIPAKGRAKRRIVLTAHYDHLGKMGRHTSYPGANDNASGVTLLFAIARKLIMLPKSSTEYIFIAFAGEEVGLLGSKHFVDNPLFDLSSVRFLLNLDIFGGAHHNITAVNGTIYKKEFELLVSTNQEIGLTPEIKARGESANSDHHWFHASGVPCFFLYSGGLNKNYHVPWDLPQDVDLVLLDKTADLLVRFVTRL